MSNIIRTLLIFIVLPLFGAEGEENYSVYFDLNSNPGTKQLMSIPDRYHNTYSISVQSENDLREAAGDDLIVDASGVYVEKNKLLSISREEIRENSQYTLKDGYLHGVIENDSVPVALEGESYYFLIPKKTYLYNSQSNDVVLYQGLSSRDFLIMSREDNGYFSCLYITFTEGKVQLKELDFDQTEFDYRKVSGKKVVENNLPTYILNPKKKEWEEIMLHFKVYDQYAIKS